MRTVVFTAEATPGRQSCSLLRTERRIRALCWYIVTQMINAMIVLINRHWIKVIYLVFVGKILQCFVISCMIPQLYSICNCSIISEIGKF